MKQLILTLIFLLNAPFIFAKTQYQIHISLSPAGSFDIKGTKVKGKISKTAGGFQAKMLKFPVKKLSSGIDLRDKHLKKKLEAKKHPYVKILKAVGKKGKGSAIISIRGIQKKISFVYKEGKGSLSLYFKINLKDFKFKGINYMGVGVKDVIKIKALLPFSAS